MMVQTYKKLKKLANLLILILSWKLILPQIHNFEIKENIKL